jgi:hypothetical protein
MRYVVALLLSIGVAFLSLAQAGQRQAASLEPALVTGLDEDYLRHLAQGETVAKTLEATDTREIVAIGAVTLPVSRETFVRSLRDLVPFKRDAPVAQFGRFSPTPSIADLNGLTLDATDLRDLRDCKPSRCKLHLPRDMVDAFHALTSPSGRQSEEERLSSLFKAFVVRRVSAYLAEGKAALEPYAQRAGVNGPAEDIDALLAASAPYLSLSPALLEHLRTFPDRRTAGVEDALYWSKEQFGWKPVITITHWALGPIVPTNGRPIVAASLQIYASHYADASLGLTLIFEPTDPDAARHACRVVYVTRVRVKATTGTFGSVWRRLIESRGRESLRRYLEKLKVRSIRGHVAP